MNFNTVAQKRDTLQTNTWSPSVKM